MPENIQSGASGFSTSEISFDFVSPHIADMLPESMYLVDDAGQLVRWSPWFSDRIVGKSQEEAASIDFLEQIHPEDRPLVAQRMNNILRLGVEESAEVRILLRGGPAYRWFLLLANRYEHNGRYFITGTGIDITRLKKGGMAMMHSEQRYRSMFEQVDSPVFITGSDGVIVYVSPAFEKISGYSLPECVGKKFTQCCDETAPGGKALSMFEEVSSRLTTIRTHEITIRKKNGSSCCVDLKLQRYHDSRTEGVMGVLYDLTQRKRLESLSEFRLALLQQAEQNSIEEILQHALDEAEELTDSRFGFIYFLYGDSGNKSGSIWSAHVREQMQTMSMLGVHHPFDVKPFMKKAIDTGRVHIVNDYADSGHACFPPGHPEVSRTLCVPILESGKVVAALLLFNKPSEYTEDDVHWVATLTNLAWDIVIRKRAALVEMRNQSILLQIQKMELIGQLAGGIAHDFNNMLGVILGNAELALTNDDLEPSVEENLQEIYHAAERSAEITSQLLAFARKQTTMPRVIDIDEAITESLPILQRVTGDKIIIDWQPSGKECKLHIDPSQLDQILMSLCFNARDAMNGYGKIVISAKRIKIDASHNADGNFRLDGEYAMLSVTDSGQGIADKHKPHVFEPFFTTKELGKGTGLGLSSVYGIVKQNRGFVDFESKEGKGSSFQIYLPLHKTKQEIGAITCNGDRTTILVVEDEPEILNLCQMMLEKSGFTVYAAHCPSEAIVLAEANSGKIDLLLTDVVMPEMNGTELSSKLSTISPGFRVLFMSGYSADIVASHGVENPLVNVIRKPFTFKALADKVRETLEVV
ncbi:MAG: PAS domain S-box protein [Chlorobaculum sp.]|nr:PAS domain S-box protein [Chlorobaculum sp.]